MFSRGLGLCRCLRSVVFVGVFSFLASAAHRARAEGDGVISPLSNVPGPVDSTLGSHDSTPSADYVRKPTDPPRFDPNSASAKAARSSAATRPAAPPVPRARPVAKDPLRPRTEVGGIVDDDRLGSTSGPGATSAPAVPPVTARPARRPDTAAPSRSAATFLDPWAEPATAPPVRSSPRPGATSNASDDSFAIPGAAPPRSTRPSPTSNAADDSFVIPGATPPRATTPRLPRDPAAADDSAAIPGALQPRPSTPIRRSPRSYLAAPAQPKPETPPTPEIGPRLETVPPNPESAPPPPSSHQPESVGFRGVESLARPSAELAPEPVRPPIDRALPAESAREEDGTRPERASGPEWAPPPPPSTDEPEAPATRVYSPTRPSATRPPTDEPMPPSTMSQYGPPPRYVPQPQIEEVPPSDRQLAPPPPPRRPEQPQQSDPRFAPPPPARAPLPAAPREGPPAVPDVSPSRWPSR